MPQDNPQTPQSPSSILFGATDLFTKPATPPGTDHSLLTPAHSINGSMSSNHTEHDSVEHNDPSNKRKRDPEDNGDREQKKVHVEESMISIEALHFDVGSKYLFLQNRKVPSFSSICNSCGWFSISITWLTRI
jgi:hypothetical protein